MPTSSARVWRPSARSTSTCEQRRARRRPTAAHQLASPRWARVSPRRKARAASGSPSLPSIDSCGRVLDAGARRADADEQERRRIGEPARAAAANRGARRSSSTVRPAVLEARARQRLAEERRGGDALGAGGAHDVHAAVAEGLHEPLELRFVVELHGRPSCKRRSAKIPVGGAPEWSTCFPIVERSFHRRRRRRDRPRAARWHVAGTIRAHVVHHPRRRGQRAPAGQRPRRRGRRPPLHGLQP